MQLKEFLTRYQADPMILEKQKIITFSIPEKSSYPIIFSASSLALFKSEGYPIEVIDLGLVTYSHLVSQLETSFLGMGLYYWLKGFDSIDNKYKIGILELLAQYHGPHKLILFLDQKDAIKLGKNSTIITLPTTVDSSLFSLILTFFKKKHSSSLIKVINQLLEAYEKLDLDQAYMMMNYIQVIGRPDDSVHPLFERVLASEGSLFLLSQHFFAKDSSSFFRLWSTLESEYPTTFWTTFWSEQLWRAYYAYYFLKQNNSTLAKSLGFRLPFTFMQRDWKKVTMLELKNAHQSIYELDLAYKNNIETQAGLDLFYSKFFLNLFCS